MSERRSLSPVTYISTDATEPGPREGIGLCLSGGGFRAMLFHLGAFRRLNETGVLRRLTRVSSVSGGSITSAMVGLAWSKLDFDEAGVGRRFEAEVTKRIRALADRTIDLPAGLLGAVLPGPASDRLINAYREHLFGHHTLQDLPDDSAGPRFVINATNFQSLAIWRFSKPFEADYRVGMIKNSTTELALAVAASSGFPPFFSPVVHDLDPGQFAPNSGEDLQREPFTKRALLADGGIYDNLGLETVWKKYKTVLVSDAGGRAGPEEDPPTDWIRMLRRVYVITDQQVRNLRSRQVVGSYQLPPDDADHRLGTYWGIRTNIAHYPLGGHLPCPHDQTMALARVKTRLAKVDRVQQERLINWGYAVCDAAIRSYVDQSLPAPAGFPYPDAGVG